MIEELIEKLEDEKELIWNDDDEYEIGFNAGIDMAISVIKEYFKVD